MSKTKQKMTKDIVPDGFTLGLAAVDGIPVVLFGVNCILLGGVLGSPLFVFGAVLCLLGGAGKVLWKVIVALKRKNVWPLFVQMRILMPVGFLLMLIGGILCRSSLFFPGMPALLFFILGLMGMVLMGVFAAKLDSSDLRSNWIEQGTNGAAQLMILIGLLCL